MKKLIMQFRILIGVAVICLLSGFYICTTSTKNVFIGIAVTGIGILFALSALFPAAKMVRIQKEEKENRIKKLEEKLEEVLELLRTLNIPRQE